MKGKRKKLSVCSHILSSRRIFILKEHEGDGTCEIILGKNSHNHAMVS